MVTLATAVLSYETTARPRVLRYMLGAQLKLGFRNKLNEAHVDSYMLGTQLKLGSRNTLNKAHVDSPPPKVSLKC